MKLFPPDPKITLYETGFGADDPFDRIATGTALSDLVERIEDPLVIALDGSWGSGKTWFLKRWVGAHKLENNGRATTVYFDAFAHDFMDDPLIALTGIIGDRLPKEAESKVWDKVKIAAAKLARPVSRIGLAVSTGGVTEIAGPIVDAAAGAISKEIEVAAETFWARENGRRFAMQQLRASLADLTRTGLKEGDDPVPLVVVVDELDRCRPDYALALLEVIKHFFSVPNVHFVLGVSLDALGHSVRARYGAGIDAERYLRRFISLSIRLPVQLSDHQSTPLAIEFFNRMASEMGINRKAIDTFNNHLRFVCQVHHLSLRDMVQIQSRLALTDPKVFDRQLAGWQVILASMILFRFIAPDLERKALDNTLTVEDVQAFYGFSPSMTNKEDHDNYSHSAWFITALWEIIVTNGEQAVADREAILGNFYNYSIGEPRKVPRRIYDEYLGTFQIMDIS